MTATNDTVWTDPDIADLVGDDPELVAIADALVATAPVAVRRRGRLPLRLGLAAAALGAVGLLALFAPWSGGGPTLGDRARAALGDAPVLHVVIAYRSNPGYVDIATGAEHRFFDRQETWYDRGRGYVHTVTRTPDGSLLDDELETPRGGWTPAGPVLDCTWIAAHPKQATKLRVSCNLNGNNGTKPRVVPRPIPTVDPALGAFLGGYQQALASGEATQTGTGTIHGTKVVWLRFKYGHETESVALDASTYRPILVRDASGTWRYWIVSIGTVSEAAADFTRPTVTELGRQASAGGRVDYTKLAVEPAAARRALPGALWLGPSFQHRPLAELERDTLRTHFADPKLAPELGVGLQLVYGAVTAKGDPDRTKPFVQLWESRSPQPAYLWAFVRGFVPPSGFLARIASGPFGATGFLVRHGVYVTVMASTPRLVLDAARALSLISR